MKYHIWTVGCQMNVADSRKLAAGLDRAGCDAVDAIEDADLVVLNTCSVREHVRGRSRPSCRHRARRAACAKPRGCCRCARSAGR